MRAIFFHFTVLLAVLTYSGCSTDAGSATVRGTLTVPGALVGDSYSVSVENDGFGVVAETSGSFSLAGTVSYAITAVESGVYFVHALVDSAPADSTPDFQAYFGGSGLIPPSQPNAEVPLSGEAVFDISL